MDVHSTAFLRGRNPIFKIIFEFVFGWLFIHPIKLFFVFFSMIFLYLYILEILLN